MSETRSLSPEEKEQVAQRMLAGTQEEIEQTFTEEEAQEILDYIDAARAQGRLEAEAELEPLVREAQETAEEALDTALSNAEDLDSVEARQDAFSRQLEHQRSKLSAVAKKATYNAVTGGTRAAQRKKKVLAELHTRAESAQNGKAALQAPDIAEIADVSTRTAQRYARDIAAEVQGVEWVKPGDGWYSSEDRKHLRLSMERFEEVDP